VIDTATIRDAVRMVAGVDGLAMNPDDLVDDVVLMAQAWPEEEDFMRAVLAVCTAMSDLISGKVEGKSLKYDLSDWRSFHFQHHRVRGAKADARIIYRHIETGIHVKGFGNRHKPQDIYRRMMAERT
jgi:hypothetical protein